MKTIEDHIEFDKQRIEDPTVSSAARRHYKDELQELQEYVGHHKKEIEAGDHHDPNGDDKKLWQWNCSKDLCCCR